MRLFKAVLLLLGAVFLVLLDVSFFANLTLGGANLMSCFIFAVLFSLTLDEKYLIFIISSALALTFLSSLPVLTILLGMILLPAALRFLRESFFPEPTVLTFPIYIISASLIFELLLIATAGEFSAAAILPVFYFILINSIVATIAFAICAKAGRALSPNKIKI